MNLEDLFPVIEIGRRYRWVDRPTEIECPECGRGMEHPGECEVVVIEKSTLTKIRCANCDYIWPFNSEGWYVCQIVSGGNAPSMVGIPFPQLERIEEEVAHEQ